MMRAQAIGGSRTDERVKLENRFFPSRLIAYYRNIAALSQKAVQTLAFNVKPFELGRNRRDLTYERALLLCQLFNTHVSTIIESTLTFSQRDLDALLFASAGAQIRRIPG
jgi:hypothetical protein